MVLDVGVAVMVLHPAAGQQLAQEVSVVTARRFQLTSPVAVLGDLQAAAPLLLEPLARSPRRHRRILS